MQIIYDHQIFGIQKFGGITRYYIELANHLTNKGHDVQIRAPLYVTRYPFGSVKPKGLPIPGRPFSISRMNAVNNLLSSFIWSNRKPVDIYHETYYGKPNVCPMKCACIITIHDMIHEKFKHLFHYDDQTSRIKKKAAIRADHIICISHNTKKDLIKYFQIEPKKISVVHHGITHVPDITLKTSNIHKPYFLFVGSRRLYKNFDGLLKAFSLSMHLVQNFNIVCFGGEKISKTDKDLISSYHLDNSIRFFFGNDSILAQLYSHAFALIYPTLYEGFGFPPLEAMAYKCPVICSNTSSIPEIAGNAAIYFDPYCSESIMNAMESLIMNTETRNRLIESGIQRSRLFSWDRCAKKTLDVYKKTTKI